MKLCRGQTMLYIGCILAGASFVIALLCFLAFTVRILGSAGSAVAFLIFAPLGMGALLMLFGVLRITALNPRYAEQPEHTRLRRLTRRAAVATVVIFMLGQLLPVAAYFGVPRVASIITPLWEWLLALTVLATLLSSALYLARLAGQIPDAALQRGTERCARGLTFCTLTVVATAILSTVAGNTIASSAALSVIHIIAGLAIVIALVFGAEYLSLMATYRRVFRRCLEEARKNEDAQHRPAAS